MVRLVGKQDYRRKKTRLSLVCDSMSTLNARKYTNGVVDHVLESVLDRKALQKEAPKSPEVKAMTNKFLAFHGVSFALNMVTLASGIYYAMRIAEKGL